MIVSSARHARAGALVHWDHRATQGAATVVTSACARTDYDVVLVGAGLANCLIAHRLKQAVPGISIALVERATRVGGDATWSFHETDVTAQQDAWLADLVVYRWPAQVVRYPAYERQIDVGYRTITSQHMDRSMRDLLGRDLRLGTEVRDVGADGVRLGDGTGLTARCVIDGRGAGAMSELSLGFQKFVGLVFETEEPHGETLPVIMDATVDQIDGYRFVYTLPFTPTRILVEDTYYSDTPDLDTDTLEDRVLRYARNKGWSVGQNVVHSEKGVLPVVLAGGRSSLWNETGGAGGKSGVRAGLFHHTTSYSLPYAVRLADAVADAVAERGPDAGLAAIDAVTRRVSAKSWRHAWFYRMLNRLLFVGAGTGERRAIMERFYRLPEPLISRFYAGQTTPVDMARILVGKPPIPIPRAVTCLPEWRARRRPKLHTATRR